MFWAQSTTRDYVRDEGEFKEWNTVERAVKREMNSKRKKKKKGVGKLGWYMSKDTSPDIPTTWRWARGDQYARRAHKQLKQQKQVDEASTGIVNVSQNNDWFLVANAQAYAKVLSRPNTSHQTHQDILSDWSTAVQLYTPISTAARKN